MQDVQEKTLSVARASGLGDIIDEISEEQGLMDFSAMSDIPIPPDLLTTDDLAVQIGPVLSDNRQTLLDAMSDEQTAFEVPYCLYGTTFEVNGKSTTDLSYMEYLLSDSDQTTVVAFDADKLGRVVEKITSNNRLNTLVIGHTHPPVAEATAKNMLTAKLSKEILTRFNIKEIGLNLSLQDLYQLVYLHEQLGDRINIMSAVLMFDGDWVFVNYDGQRFTKTLIPKP